MNKNAVRQLHAKLIAKAWKDPVFKELLLKNPHEAFKQCGYDIPVQLDIRIIEEDQEHFYLVLPKFSLFAVKAARRK
ncbi:MAG: NHLP leader peptide family RiPP precursor [Parachlamydiales bacterium]|nr:NHLP leader peptide family RiPP precursor [Parachlamydiales bacterium]